MAVILAAQHFHIGGEMVSISAALGTTMLSSNLHRQNSRRLGLYGHHHENLFFLYVPETRLRRETLEINFVAKAVDSSPSVASGDKSLIPDGEFTLAKISFGVIRLGLGSSNQVRGIRIKQERKKHKTLLLTRCSPPFLDVKKELYSPERQIGLSTFHYIKHESTISRGMVLGLTFNILPGSEWSAIMLTYGFPLAIIGMALKYAELKPVPCLSYADAVKLRESSASPILTQGGGIPRRSAPILTMIREERNSLPFFGPNITAEVGKGESENLYDVRLISNVSTNSVS
ncbi:unnamed protein product [Brassica oleracea]